MEFRNIATPMTVILLVAAFTVSNYTGSDHTGHDHSRGASTEEVRTLQFTFPKEAVNEDWVPVGWPVVDNLASQGGIYEYYGIIDRSAEQYDWTDEYWKALTERRKKAIQYCQDYQPRISVIGQAHGLMLEHGSEEMLAGVNEIQQGMYNQLVKGHTKTTIVLDEGMMADDLPYDEDRLRAMMKRSGKSLKNVDLPTKKADELPKDAILTLMGFNKILIYGIEEWPLFAQVAVGSFERDVLQSVLGEKYWEQSIHDHNRDHEAVKQLSDHDRVALQLAKRLSTILATLRSDIALINAVETLQRTGSDHAQIVIGDGHVEDFMRAQPLYGFELGVWRPDRDLLKH